MAVPNSEAVQWLPSGSTRAESRSGRIGPISLEAKQTGERSAGNPHAAFDEAGAGNVARPRWCDTRRRKSEPTGNTNFGLTRRASPRPYQTLEKNGDFTVLIGGSPLACAPSAPRNENQASAPILLCVPCWLALSVASVTPSRPCHVSSPRLVERSMRISRTALSCLLRPKDDGTYPAGAAFGAGRTTR